MAQPRPEPPLPRLCEMDDAARGELVGALTRLHADLGKLSGGAGFCEDRGYGWSLESEKGYRENILAEFERRPVLKRLMHDSWVLLATGATIGDRPIALAEVSTARAALRREQSFDWTTGDGMAAIRHTITLGPVEVRVRSETLVAITAGRPSPEAEGRYSYEDFGQTPTWLANIEGIGDLHWPLSAVFARFRRYFFTCDACTAQAGSIGFSARNTRIESTSPLAPAASCEVDAEAAGRVQAALLENDFRVLHELDPALVPAYCPACDHVYCPSHCAPAPPDATTTRHIVCGCGRSRDVRASNA